ncbi:MAG: hypothetical protein PHO41_10260, partial [Eubacteriales bacterium]|nr:hypothetical protein [Eubacteriales bacterium]
VNKATLTAEFKLDGGTEFSKEYKGSDYIITATAEGVQGEDEVALTLTGDVTATNADSYTATASLDASYTNYTMTATEQAWAIVAKSLEVTWTGPFTWEYDGNDHAPSASASTGIIGETISIDVNGEERLASATAYTATAFIKDVPLKINNYTLTGETHEYTITPKTVTFKWNTTNDYEGDEYATAYTYDKTTQGVYAFITNGVPEDDIALVYSGNEATNANDYTATITDLSGTKASNYALPASGLTKSWEIGKATLTDTTEAVTATYDGQAHYLTVALTGFYEGDSIEDGTFSFSADGTTYTAANYGIIGVAASKEVFYNVVYDNYATVSGSKWVTITKAQLTEPAVTGAYTYTGAEQTATLDANYNSSIMSIASGNTGTDADTYTLIINITNANYEWADSADGNISWTIAPATLSYTANDIIAASKVYTGSALSWTSGNFTAPANTSVTDVAVISEQDYTHAGNPTITVTLTASDNYTFEVNEGDTKDFTVTLSITKAQLTEPTVTGAYTYTGDEQTATLDANFNEATMTVTSGNTGTAAGNYTIDIAIDDTANYEWAGAADGQVNWSIGQATNGWMSALSIDGWVYSETAKEPTAETTFGTPEFTYSDSEDGVYTSTVPSTAGTWWVKAEVAGTTDYTSIENAISFQIAQATNVWLTSGVAINNWIYGETAQTPFSFTKFGTPVYAYAEEGSEEYSSTVPTEAGNYKVKASVAETTDYTGITSASTAFTIYQKAVAEPTLIGTYVYNGAEQTAVLSGYLASIMSIDGNKQTAAGDYTIHITFNTTNYIWASAEDGDISWTIGQATNSWTATLDIDGWVYGDNANVPTAQAIFGTPAFTYSDSELGTYTSTVPSTAGTWWVKANVTETTDYTGIDAVLSFQIAKAQLTEPTVTGTYTYTGNLQTATLDANYDEATMNIASGNKGTDAGTYTIQIEILDTDNYEWAAGADGNVNWTILQLQDNVWTTALS